jgi:rhodanese-related sulfurtransferase
MFKKIIKFFQGTDYKELIANGAIVLDVRTAVEYSGGKIAQSKNIPLDTISKRALNIKKWDKQVICCCKSGMRSAQATSILKSHGVDAVNGGGWFSLNAKLR